MNNANSGITITPNGGTFDVPAGVALTIDNPITNSPDGPGLLTSTDGGTLVLNANDSGFTGGVNVMNGNTFDLAAASAAASPVTPPAQWKAPTAAWLGGRYVGGHRIAITSLPSLEDADREQ